MPSHLLQQGNDAAEIAYWRNRVSCLEMIVGELLAKNQQMRFVIEAQKQEPSATASPCPLNGSHPVESWPYFAGPQKGISKGLSADGCIWSTDSHNAAVPLG